jgi:hypothetical protein
MPMMQSKAYSEARDFKVGDAVTVKGLKMKPQHNGKTGTVFGHKSDRVQVQLQDKNMTELALKPDNLKPNMDVVIKIIDKGFESEEKMLPILREHEAKDKDSAKFICIMMRKSMPLWRESHEGENWRSIPWIRDFCDIKCDISEKGENGVLGGGGGH